MTEHEQVWTDTDIIHMHRRAFDEYPNVGQMAAYRELCDAWQADHDQLVTANEQMAGQIDDLVAQRDAAKEGQRPIMVNLAKENKMLRAERDETQHKLDAANARIAELEGQRIDAMEVAGAILYDALLDDESEADIEAQQQPNADGLLPCPWCLKTPRKINKPNSTIIVCWVESCLVAPAVVVDI